MEKNRRTAWETNEGRIHRDQNLMPNQRDPKKTRVAIWLLPEERKMLADLAKKQGTNMTDVIRQKLTELRDTKKK